MAANGFRQQQIPSFTPIHIHFTESLGARNVSGEAKTLKSRMSYAPLMEITGIFAPYICNNNCYLKEIPLKGSLLIVTTHFRGRTLMNLMKMHLKANTLGNYMQMKTCQHCNGSVKRKIIKQYNVL